MTGTSGLGAAEEGVEDVAEAAETASAAEGASSSGVVLGALALVAQHVVGVRDVFEALGRLRARVHIGVEFAREPAIRLLDLVGRGVA